LASLPNKTKTVLFGIIDNSDRLCYTQGMDKNLRTVVRFGAHRYKNGFWVDGYWLDCGHFQKMPSGMQLDLSSDRFFAFYKKAMAGQVHMSCHSCAQKSKQA